MSEKKNYMIVSYQHFPIYHIYHISYFIFCTIGVRLPPALLLHLQVLSLGASSTTQSVRHPVVC